MAGKKTYLREWRLKSGLTQKQVVDRLGMHEDEKLPKTEASLSRFETGAVPYHQRILEALADIYGTSPADLFGRNPFMEGKIYDLLAHMDDSTRADAEAMLGALADRRQAYKAG